MAHVARCLGGGGCVAEEFLEEGAPLEEGLLEGGCFGIGGDLEGAGLEDIVDLFEEGVEVVEVEEPLRLFGEALEPSEASLCEGAFGGAEVCAGGESLKRGDSVFFAEMSRMDKKLPEGEEGFFELFDEVGELCCIGIAGGEGVEPAGELFRRPRRGHLVGGLAEAQQ